MTAPSPLGPGPFITRGNRNTETMFCHNQECKLLNKAQSFRWSSATWDEPSEWVDEPECRACGSECHEIEWEDEDE